MAYKSADWEMTMAKAYILKIAGQVITSGCEAQLVNRKLIVKAASRDKITEICLNLDANIAYEITFSNKTTTFGWAHSGMSLVQLSISRNPRRSLLKKRIK